MSHPTFSLEASTLPNRLLTSPQRRNFAISCGSLPTNKRESSLKNATSQYNTKRRKRSEAHEEKDAFQLYKLQQTDEAETNDEIHGSIELVPVAKALVDTEAFQRLRHIKQLGAAQYLYVSADHNRFQHSLGVYHLAREMVERLRQKQPQFGVTDKDVLCVSLAGLLHDIGHGPFSHVYEIYRTVTLPEHFARYPELEELLQHYPDVPENWGHELSSLQMVDAALAELGLMIDSSRLDEPLKQIGHGIDAKSMRVIAPAGNGDLASNNMLDTSSILTSRDWIFIKECIWGKPLPEVGGDTFLGRTDPTIHWLYDIVNNRHSGLDLDKMDYYARDRKRAMLGDNQYFKMIREARVAPAICPVRAKCFHGHHKTHRHFMICYPKKHISTVMTFFHERHALHQHIYQRKKTSAAKLIVCDILALAEPFFRLKSHLGEEFPISRAVAKSDWLIRLNDNVITLIEHSPDPRLKEAQDLIRCLNSHQFYKCAVDVPLNLENPCHTRINKMKPLDIADAMLEDNRSNEPERGCLIPNLSHKDFVVEFYNIHHGCKDANPLLRVRFFDETNRKFTGPVQDIPEAVQISEPDYLSILPQQFQKKGFRVYARHPEKRNLELMRQLCYRWIVRMQGSSSRSPSTIQEMGENDDSDSQHDVSSYHREQRSPAVLTQDSP